MSLVDELGSKGEAVLAGPHFAAAAILKPDAKSDDVMALEVASRDEDSLAGVFSDGREQPLIALVHRRLEASRTARTASRSAGLLRKCWLPEPTVGFAPSPAHR